PATLRAVGLGAVHGSEIVHVLHSYDAHLGRRLHPLGKWLTPAVGRRMQRTWLQFADAAGSDSQPWSREWPRYDVHQRATRVIRSFSDIVVDDPDAPRRGAWEILI
ncbi:MAG TPA: hypothetical protein VK662_09285, partial [Acidothermaceae bacterium]|nr:hypothetical protein [Acidothermaceae bacterium]